MTTVEGNEALTKHPQGWRLRRKARNRWLVVHLLLAGIWFGIDVVMAVLVFTALGTDDDSTKALAYQALDLFVVPTLLAAGLLTLATGVVLGLGTKYGLVRFWWVVAKLVLNLLLAGLVLVALGPEVSDAADRGERFTAGESASLEVGDLLFPPIVSPLALLGAVLLGIYKPWGRIRGRWGRRAAGSSALVVLLVLAVGTSSLGAAATASAGADAEAADRSPSVTSWIKRHASPLDTVDPQAPLDDLTPLGTAIGDAAVIGLGESVHGAAELITLKHRALRLLVEDMGFRTVAWEEDWSTGVLVDDYIQGSAGDLDALVAQMSPQWQSHEVGDVLQWLRDYNAGRPDDDKVRFFGVEHFFTWHPAYDAVEAYVAERAPGRLPELGGHYDVVEPRADNVFAHIDEYSQVEDKQPFIDHARAVHDLVAAVPHAPGDLTHELALHAARQIVAFYEHFSLPENDGFVFRDARAAENLRWWRGISGDRIAYWGASPHTANVPELRITRPPEPDMVFRSAGSYIRSWFGSDYLSIGFTLDHGTVGLGGGDTAVLPPPERHWFERPFGRVRAATFALDLRAPAPRLVRQWLTSPLTTRGLPDHPGSTMSGSPLAQWYDVVVHRQDVSPVATNGR